MDVLGLPLHAVHPGHASAGRSGPAGHPAALAALLAPTAAAGPAGCVGGGGRDAFVRFHRGRYGQHQQRPTHGPLVDHEPARGRGGAADPPPRAAPQPVVQNDMLLSAAASGDWLMYGHNYWNNRFSPLKTINTANVKNLVPRAVYTHGSERLGSFETTPIVVNGVM